MGRETKRDLLERVEDLEERLREAEETLRALRNGEVDAIVASGPDGDHIYTLTGTDQTYRVMVERMAEGALTLTREGLILFSNERFATMVRRPLEQVIGARIHDFVVPGDAEIVSALLGQSDRGKAEARLKTDTETIIPAYLSFENLALNGDECLCLIVTDLTEQKRSQKIVAAEKFASLILERAAEAILVVDPNGIINRASRTASRLAGKAVPGCRFDEAFRISLASGMDYPFRQILSAAEGGGVHHLEVAALRPDGRKIELILSAAALSGTERELLGCVVHLTDITDWKSNQRQLKFQADIIETTAEAIIATDSNHRVTFWNSGAECLYGVSKEDALGKQLNELHDDRWLNPEDELRAQAALEEDGTWSGEKIHVRKDGTQIAVSSILNVIGPEHGGGLVEIVRDVTDSKEAEATLRESEARERSRAAELEALMEAVPAAVLITRDVEGQLVLGNHTSYDVLHMPRGANLSQYACAGHFRVLKDSKDIAPEDFPIQVAARTGQAVQGCELELLFDNGDSRQLIGNAVPLFSTDRRPSGAIGAFVDITGRKRAEQERLKLAATERTLETEKALRVTEAELARVTRALAVGEISASIAHEINQPLAGVVTNAEAGLRWLGGETPNLQEVRASLGLIVRDGNRASEVIRRIRDFTKKGSQQTASLDINEVIQDATLLAHDALVKRHISLRAEIADDLPPVRGDRIQLQQVILNLIMNGAEASDSASGPEELLISSHRCLGLGGHALARVAVRDHGVGMKPEYMDRMFEPFFTTKPEGMGMGLSLSRSIIESHGGRIWAEANDGPGLTIQFTLPVESEKKS